MSTDWETLQQAALTGLCVREGEEEGGNKKEGKEGRGQRKWNGEREKGAEGARNKTVGGLGSQGVRRIGEWKGSMILAAL